MRSAFIQPTPAMPWVLAGVGLLVVLVAGLAMLGLFLLWRNGYVRGWRAARVSPPACPKCGYNLSGLTHCRCPECGTEYKLDELWKIAQKETLRSGKSRESRPSEVEMLRSAQHDDPGKRSQKDRVES